jgi:protein-disulfide isomerase
MFNNVSDVSGQGVQFTPPEGAPRLGDANAKVTIVEFADFQCPFCGRFQQSVYPQIKSEYIDTGKATLVYQDFAFLGEESTVAAEAAKCAGDQGKFWEYHDYLFTHQKGENQGAFVARNLKAFARLLKLDVAKFNACLDSGQKKQAVEDETTAGKNIGVTGTPTIIVNGKVFVGALPFDTFKQAIDEAFAK